MKIKPKNLGCPYCWSTFRAKKGWVGYGPNEHEDIVGWVCENSECEAEWNKDGLAILAPRAEFEDDK